MIPKRTETSHIEHQTNEDETGKENICIYWFRNAMRLHDNPSFLKACQISKFLIPLYIIDPECPFAQTPNCSVGINRANFVVQSLANLNQNMTSSGGDNKQPTQSKLIVLRGKPEKILPTLASEFQCSHLIFEAEAAYPIRVRDSKTLAEIRKQHGTIKIMSFDTHTMFEMKDYESKVTSATGNIQGLTAFRKIFERMGPVPQEAETIQSEKIPPLPPDFLQVLSSSEKFKSTTFRSNTSSEPGLQEIGQIPSLESLGYDTNDILKITSSPQNTKFPGGENEALARLNKILKRKKWIAEFEKPNTKPNALECDTTGLSPYIKHGCLSIRTFYHGLSAVYSEFKDHTKPPVSLHGQLLWREYNYLTGYTTENFDKMIGNPKARQIPWDDNEELLLAWKEGRTGYPFIDAIMTELRTTGWIHHLARHAVACFLTRGDLWQSWEKGACVFEELLLDADWSVNNFNWQWLSCTSHFYQYYRCYSPISFGKKTDKEGDYIRKWLPIFKNFPTKYIYEPWTAPKQVQLSSGIVIGVDFPTPIVDHRIVSQLNMAKMKEAYQKQKEAQSDGALTGEKKAASSQSSLSSYFPSESVQGPKKRGFNEDDKSQTGNAKRNKKT